MPFTITEIEQAIATHRPEWPRFHPENIELRKSINYTVIMNYLTGQATTLSGIQPEDKIHYWGTLINLLHNLENKSPDEQLVLDVISEPTLSRHLLSNLNHWLLLYAVNNKNDKSFHAVLLELKKQGMNNDLTFNFFITGIHDDDNKALDEDRTGLVNFLLDYIRQSPKLVMPSYGYGAWRNEWSTFYFKLLEEAKPAFAIEYALKILQTDRDDLAEFLATYKEGKYLHEIIATLTDLKNPNVETIRSKFRFAIELYEMDQSKYKELVIELSKQYIRHYILLNPRQTYEGSVRIKEFAENDTLSHFPYATAAFHFLLLHQKENALDLLEQWFKNNLYVNIRTLTILERHLHNDAYPFFELALKTGGSGGEYGNGIDYVRQGIDLLHKKFQPEQFLPLLWSLVNTKSKPLRELLAKVLSEADSAAEKKAITLLQNKNSEARQTAATILSYFRTESSKEAVMKILDTETNDNARDILLQTVSDNFSNEASIDFIEGLIASATKRGKLNKPVEAWLDESLLSPLFYTTGVALTINEKRFLFYRMSRIKEMRSDIEAKYILQYLDKERSSDFALCIMKLYMDKDAKPEHKYLMALAASLGNDAVTDKILITINRWMDENRYKMAEHGVGALALQGSDKALRWVEWYSRKYKVKKANVGAAALKALKTAAEELGISVHELGDRVVPDFGFNGLFKHFNIAGEEYRAFIDSNFKIAFFNEENKKLKAIPASASASLKDEFKTIAKEVKDIVKSQSSRLEYYLIIQRRWSFQNWKKFFLSNPVMFIYATKFLWGIYNEQEQLTGTFICNEDTSQQNIEGDEIILAEDAVIGIVHPSQLSTEKLQLWKQQFFDLSIDPVFPQLDRKIPVMEDINVEKSIISNFAGKQMKTGSIRSTLEKYGWHSGPVGDGGMIDSFNLLHSEKNIEAVLEVEGVGAGYGWGMDEKLQRLYILDKTKTTGRWISYIKNEEDERLVKLKDIPTIFLNEMLAAIQSIKVFEKLD